MKAPCLRCEIGKVTAALNDEVCPYHTEALEMAEILKQVHAKSRDILDPLPGSIIARTRAVLLRLELLPADERNGTS